MGAIFSFALLIVIGFAVWFAVLVTQDNNHVNRLNEQFSAHCLQLGGHAVIQAHDICISDTTGAILDYEH